MDQRGTPVSRRNLLKTTTGIAGVTAATLLTGAGSAAAEEKVLADGNSRVAVKGNINHSVCLWCYKGMKSTDMAPVAKRLGLKAIDLLTPKDWAPAQRKRPDLLHDLRRLGRHHARGSIAREHHDEIVEILDGARRRQRRRGLPQRHLLQRQPRKAGRRGGHQELRRRRQEGHRPLRSRRRSRSAWSCSTAR